MNATIVDKDRRIPLNIQNSDVNNFTYKRGLEKSAESVKKKLFQRYVLISCLAAAFNVLLISNRYLSYLIASLEVAVLIYKFIKNDITGYMAYYTIFICNCLEFIEFFSGGVSCDLKNIRILGVNLGVWLLLLVAFPMFFRTLHMGRLKITQPLFFRASIGLIMINIVALLVGAFLLIVNDNQILNIPRILIEYINAGYAMFFLPITMFAAFYHILIYENKSAFKIGLALQATLIGSVFQNIIAIKFSIYGSYGSAPTLLRSSLGIYIPFLLLMGINRKTVYPMFTTIVAFIGIMLGLRYNSSGKLILVSAIVVVAWIIHLFKRKNPLAICIVIVLCLTIPGMVQRLILNNELFAAKIMQVIRLVRFWRSDWLANMPPSPRMRISEMLNVFVEFYQKPWLIFTGKGYCGSILDHIKMFGSWTPGQNAFSDIEWKYNIFYRMHEIASNLLMFGLMGIFYSVGLIKAVIKQYKKNIWIAVGTFWFIIFYGYSFTISVFGIVALFYGLIQED